MAYEGKSSVLCEAFGRGMLARRFVEARPAADKRETTGWEESAGRRQSCESKAGSQLR